MYSSLLIIHNLFRWIAFLLLLYAIYRAFTGYRSNNPFSAADNSFRHWTATVLQVQLMIGFILYFNSPFVQAYWNNSGDDTFFAIVHAALMFTAVTIVSVGSAMAKRKTTDLEKFKTMLTWFGIGLLIILIAIPWPFSPLAQRPYLRIS
ncbi:MAG TPA: hypothetical protein VFE50_08485 [Cyclobacteriaceae bacterium]|nr:hypothetical protein [Cyclobacteriaceae bacterium]